MLLVYIYRMDEEKFLQANSGAGITFLISQKDAFLESSINRETKSLSVTTPALE